MKCYYEILSVARDADEAEIKSCYRKLALKFHPDKNLDNPEEAKEQFQFVQQAYEVLSDRQERAWYDNHREQILKGSNKDYEDNCLDVYQYFTTSCFKGYDDEEKGFYAVYKNVFETLSKEEIEHLDSKSDFDDIPMFGSSTSDYEDIVAPFYAYWMSFTTRKSYVWLDPYDIKETRERRILKLIEKENKKVRQKAKKERNEEIRNLVAFVRKRDKRVQANTKLMEQKNLENRQKHEELRKQKLRERRQELNESNTEAEWSKFDNLTTELQQIEKNLVEQFGEKISDSEEEEYIEDNLYCVACNKIFKNAKAFANHESSKKHKENLAKIREDMEAEEELKTENGIEEEETEENISDVELETESETEIIEENLQRKKKSKKSKKIITLDSFSSDEKLETEIDDAVADDSSSTATNNKTDDFASAKKQKKKKKNSAKNPQQIQSPTHCEDGNNIPLQSVPIKKNKKQGNSKSNNNKFDEEEELDVSHFCLTCKSKFDTKNKLFEHLKKSGHSIVLPQNTKQTKKSKKNLQ